MFDLGHTHTIHKIHKHPLHHMQASRQCEKHTHFGHGKMRSFHEVIGPGLIRSITVHQCSPYVSTQINPVGEP